MFNIKRGWVIVLAGLGINLAFGVLYSWSVFSKSLIDTYGWTRTEASLPYTAAILVFAIMMIPAGKLQDKYGPRLIASLGGVFAGAGLIFASFLTNLPGLIFSFGVMTGTGLGLGYASATPVAVKWFPSEKKGIVTGIVVAGFGLSPIYMAPLANKLIQHFGLFPSFRILGIAFFLVVISLSQLFKNPPAAMPSSTQATINIQSSGEEDYSWREMIKTKQFYQLWILLACGSLGGLMVIGHLSKIVSSQSGRDIGFILVALSAIFNASGRPISGFFSDKIGRTRTLLILFSFEFLIFLAFSQFNSFITLLFGAAVVTYAYGSLFAIIPSIVSDFYGKNNLGLNYGLLFSAWGIGGVIGPMLAGKIADITGSYNAAYMIAAALCFIAILLAWRIKHPQRSDASN